MVEKKVAIGASLLFCILVALLLLILYYPDQSRIEDDELKEWEDKNIAKVNTAATETLSEESTLTQLSKTLEEIGILILVLIAVIFVVLAVGCCTCCFCL